MSERQHTPNGSDVWRTDRWWWPTTLRQIILEFPTAEDAVRYDNNPDAPIHIEPKKPR
jgi:hypothetical protein